MPPTEAGEETQGALEGGTDDEAGRHAAYPVRQQHNTSGDENGSDAPSRVALRGGSSAAADASAPTWIACPDGKASSALPERGTPRRWPSTVHRSGRF
jgi:hypothetical protein